MLFNSLTFIVFLTICVILFWTLKPKARVLMLFISSLVFYGFWRWDFVLLMLFSTFLDYFISLKIHNSTKVSKRRVLILTTLILNIGLLVVFKYLFFITENVNSVLALFTSNLSIDSLKLILPLGISFYTFQTVSYSLDVYRGHCKPERNFILYGAYVTFFPQLVAGPILRADEVIDQLKVRKKFSPSFILEGLKRILFGLFLKVVLADNIAPLVDEAFASNLDLFSAFDVLTISFLFGFQIFFDFAGYSHIAIGCAKLMGIDFPENFNFPYIARSFKDFWKRWHISLSSWIRDYLYLPILGVKVINKNSLSEGGIEVIENKKKRNSSLALFLTWAIMGLWHGANWTFVFWGVYHSFFIFCERFIVKSKYVNKRLRENVGWFIVLPITMLSWIPFRAESLSDAFQLYEKMFHIKNYSFYSLRENYFLIAAILLLGFLLAYYTFHWKPRKNKLSMSVRFIGEILVYSTMLFLVYVFLRPISQFIYFQF